MINQQNRSTNRVIPTYAALPVLTFCSSNIDTLIIKISGAWGGRGIEIRYGIDHLIPSGVQDACVLKDVVWIPVDAW